MATIRNLQVKIGADISELKSKMGQAEGVIKQFVGMGKALAGLAIADTLVNVGRAMFDVTKKTAEYANTIDLFSKKTGVGIVETQQLSYAAKKLDVELSTIESSMGKFTGTIKESINQESNAAKMFKALGISVKDTKGKIRPVNDVFMETIEALTNVKNEGARSIAMQELFGKSFQGLIPLVDAGADKLNEYMERAKDLGLVMSEQEIEQADQYGKKLEEIGTRADAAGRSITSSLLPALHGIMDAIDATMTNGAIGLDALGKMFQSWGKVLTPIIWPNGWQQTPDASKLKPGQPFMSDKWDPSKAVDPFQKMRDDAANAKTKSKTKDLSDAINKAFGGADEKAKNATESTSKFADAFVSAFERMSGAVKLFDKATYDKAYGMSRFTTRLMGQANQLKTYKDALMTLKSKVNSQFYNALAAEGPSAGKQLSILARSSGADLAKAQSAFMLKTGYAKEATAMQVAPQFGVTPQTAWQGGQVVFQFYNPRITSTKDAEEIMKVVDKKLKGIGVIK